MAFRTRWLVGSSLVIASLGGFAAAACSSSSDAPAAQTGEGGALNPGRDGAVQPTDDDAATDADAASEVDAAKCLAEAMDAGVDCTSNPACSAACGHLVDHYKGEVAHLAATCALALSTCQASDAVFVIPCVDNAVARACSDPSAKAFCATLVAGCSDAEGDSGAAFTQVGCEPFASAMSAAGRAAFAACITDGIPGTCTKDVVACLDAIRK